MLIKQVVYIQSPHFPAASFSWMWIWIAGSPLQAVHPLRVLAASLRPMQRLHFCLCLTLVAHSVHVTITPFDTVSSLRV